MQPVIRSRQPVDLAACARVLRAVHVRHRYPINWPGDPVKWLDPPGVEAAWVAIEHDEVVGHICLTSPPAGSQRLAVERLFVAPAVGGHGVGGALLRTAVGWASERGRSLALEVADNCADAIALYRRLGWRETTRTQIDWGDAEASYLIRFDAP